MNGSIIDIFGSKVKYIDEEFNNIDVPTFYGYNENQGDIKYTNNSYIANYIEGGGGDVPFIHQEVQKVLKYTNKIEVYVKTAFIDTEYVESSDDFDYIIYKNFKNDKFEEKLSKTTSIKFYEGYSSNENYAKISLNPHPEISDIKEDLNTYVYTFELDKATGEYYLSSFNIYE